MGWDMNMKAGGLRYELYFMKFLQREMRDE
jgi:hypothetical protein